MTTQEENELICEKLLGWKPERRTVAGLVHVAWWDRGPGRSDTETTPCFTTWVDAGLILDAMKDIALQPMLYFHGGGCDRWECSFATLSGASLYFGNTGPLAIRAAALEYIKSL
jgi:hypothetical protein